MHKYRITTMHILLSIRLPLKAYLSTPSNDNHLDSILIPSQTPGSHRTTKLVSPAKGDPARDDVDWHPRRSGQTSVKKRPRSLDSSSYTFLLNCHAKQRNSDN
jgi:hypothetical protein